MHGDSPHLLHSVAVSGSLLSSWGFSFLCTCLSPAPSGQTNIRKICSENFDLPARRLPISGMERNAEQIVLSCTTEERIEIHCQKHQLSFPNDINETNPPKKPNAWFEFTQTYRWLSASNPSWPALSMHVQDCPRMAFHRKLSGQPAAMLDHQNKSLRMNSNSVRWHKTWRWRAQVCKLNKSRVKRSVSLSFQSHFWSDLLVGFFDWGMTDEDVVFEEAAICRRCTSGDVLDRNSCNFLWLLVQARLSFKSCKCTRSGWRCCAPAATYWNHSPWKCEEVRGRGKEGVS